MTAFWKAPSADYPYLELPILQKTKHINRHQIKRATQSSSLSVSPDFITVWNTAPRHVNCKKELTARLSILGLGLMALIVHAKKNLTVTKKTGSHDLVTEVDEGIEMLLRIWFQSHYPHHKLIGEEGHKAMITPDDIVWYIDPIDGTANFINHHPDYTIHIASVHQGRPYVLFFGIPERHLFYCSDEKKDAYSLKPCNNDDSICIGTEFFDFQTHKQTQLDSIQLQLQARSQRFKSIGIHIHNMLHQNSCSAFYKDQIKLWDLIAPLSLL